MTDSRIDIDRYPTALRAGYYDGSKLIGTLDDGDAAEYYNPNSHGIVTYRYNEDEQRLDAAFDPERSLRCARTVADYIRETHETVGYDELSDWATEKLHSVA